MVKIISIIKQHKKYLVNYIVFTNRGRSDMIGPIRQTHLHEDQILTYRIFKDQEVDDKTFDQMIEEGVYFDLLKDATRYATFKLRTKYEVVKYLLNKSADDGLIVRVILKLEQQGLLDDRRYTQLFIQEQLRNLKGPNLIKNKLLLKGVKESIIEDVLAQFPSDPTSEGLYLIIEKEVKKLKKYPIKRQRGIIMQKLLRSGYKTETIMEAFKNVEWDSDHLEQMKKDFNESYKKYGEPQKIIARMLLLGYQFQEFNYLFKEKKNAKKAD